MKTKFFFIIFSHVSVLYSQTEEFKNTYVYTFNNYFYPWGNNPTETTSKWYNPYLQFSLSYPGNGYPYPQPGCLTCNSDTCNRYIKSRFNIINYNFIVGEKYPDLYCNRGIEKGEGINNSGSIRVSIRGINDKSGGIRDSNNFRSRVEFLYFPKHYDDNTGYTANIENQTYYYRWSFFIPDDSRFKDTVLYNGNNAKSWHIISQFHYANHYMEKFDPIKGIRITERYQSDTVLLKSGDQPAIFISYGHKVNAHNNKRDINFLYGYRNTDIQTGSNKDRSSNFKLVDGINKGEWNTIILKIKWSPYDNIGYMRVWVNGNVVYGDIKEINTEISNPNYQTKTPEIIKGANMLVTQDGKILSNFMQMGHYRGYLDTEATIIFDDLIITQDSSIAFNGFKTKLKPEYCGKVLNNWDFNLQAIPIPEISKYKFRFEKISTENIKNKQNLNNILEIEKETNNYNLLENKSFFNPNNSYTVKVFVKVKGEEMYREDTFIDTISIGDFNKLKQ